MFGRTRLPASRLSAGRSGRYAPATLSIATNGDSSVSAERVRDGSEPPTVTCRRLAGAISRRRGLDFELVDGPRRLPPLAV